MNDKRVACAEGVLVVVDFRVQIELGLQNPKGRDYQAIDQSLRKSDYHKCASPALSQPRPPPGTSGSTPASSVEGFKTPFRNHSPQRSRQPSEWAETRTKAPVTSAALF